MPSTALIIGQTQRAAIAELRAVAAASPVDPIAAAATAAQDIDAYRDAMQTRSLLLPVGYAVTYTQERQPAAPPPGLCHHISISVDRRGRLPHPAAVEMILKEFGMKPPTDDGPTGIMWIEDIAPGEKAVNVVQLIEPQASDR